MTKCSIPIGSGTVNGISEKTGNLNKICGLVNRIISILISLVSVIVPCKMFTLGDENIQLAQTQARLKKSPKPKRRLPVVDVGESGKQQLASASNPNVAETSSAASSGSGARYSRAGIIALVPAVPLARYGSPEGPRFSSPGG